MAEKGFFEAVHRELDAKMVPAGKWSLPLCYPGGSVAEHRHTRTRTSIFDRTGSRCFQISGSDAAKKLDSLFLYPVNSLAIGKVMDDLMLREDGTIGNFFTLCRMQQNDFLLLLDRNTAENDAVLLVEKISKILDIRELSQAMAVLTLCGKNCREVLMQAGAENIPANGSWQMITVKDDEGDEFRCIAVGHDRFGEAGIDLCFNCENAEELYGAIYRISGVEPAGMGAWESLRIESGIPALNSDIRPDMLPPECGLTVDMSREFFGKAALCKAEIARKIIVLDLERHPAGVGTVVKLPGNIAAGVVSGGAFCPVSGIARVLCIVDADCPAENGSVMECEVNGKAVCGTVAGIAVPEMLCPEA